MAKAGVIRKITIKDFVTYSDVELYPGQYLNVVLGANGTGKSTIVAAIILGLGGSPKIVGRGKKISEYVRNGCTESRIDIELQGEKTNLCYVITRSFNVSNQSTWYLSNKHVTENEIKALIRRLNIQVDNLCQFLPQDRVQDFAKMDKRELLINTQIAVGRHDLVEKQHELIDIKATHTKLETDLNKIVAELEQLETRVSRLEGKVKNIEEKTRFLADIETIKQKIAWQDYDRLLETQRSIEVDRKQAERIVTIHKNKLKPIEEKINQLKHNVTATQNSLVNTKNTQKQSKQNIERLLSKLQESEYTRNEILVDMRSKLQSLAEYRSEIDVMKAKISKLENDEQSLTTMYGDRKRIEFEANKLEKESANCAAKSMEFNRQRLAVMDQQRGTNDEIYRMETKLGEIENVRTQRLQMLKRLDSDAYQAVFWLKNNQNLFEGKIYEPIVLELNVINPEHSKYLENVISLADRIAFTCELRADMNTFMRHVREQQGLRVNVLHSGAEHPPLSTFRPPKPIETLRNYGFYTYVLSLVQGPESILKYLCRMYNIHRIPIGDHTTYAKSTKVPAEISVFFSDSQRFSVMRSQYSGARSTSITELQSNGMFAVNVDQTRLNELKRNLNRLREGYEEMREQIDSCLAQEQTFENKRIQLLKERQNVLQNTERIKAIRDRINESRKTLEQRVANQQTPEQIKAAANEKIQKLLTTSLKSYEEIMKLYVNYDSDVRREAQINLEKNHLHDRIEKLENQMADSKLEYEDTLQTFNQIDRIYKSAEKDAQTALRNAKAICENISPDHAEFARKFQDKFDELPSDLPQLKILQNELQTKAECILTADSGEMRQYEDAKRAIDTNRGKLKEMEVQMREIKDEMKTKYDEWIQPLNEIIDQINRNFGECFESMQCCGEVALSTDGGMWNYQCYGLTIRVTYRTNEPLQELNRYTQSGGERAVATAIFMLSMQNLTSAPFRCVDEINQGMDPQNEKRIFEILVKVTSHQNTCQYFLVTPKLIPGLEFGGSMKVHIVHNGPFCHVPIGYSYKRKE